MVQELFLGGGPGEVDGGVEGGGYCFKCVSFGIEGDEVGLLDDDAVFIDSRQLGGAGGNHQGVLGTDVGGGADAAVAIGGDKTAPAVDLLALQLHGSGSEGVSAQCECEFFCHCYYIIIRRFFRRPVRPSVR